MPTLRRALACLPLMLLAACNAPGDGGGDDDDATEPACAYPDGAAEPMELGEVLFPYSWPSARSADGADVPLDLGHVPCATDEEIDWSPFDVLLFVSIPAW